MVEEQAESDSDEDSDYDSFGSDTDDSWFQQEENEYALRGLRFFTNLLEGEEHDQLDLIDEYQDEQSNSYEKQQLPTVDFVAEKLKEQGVTFEQLIAWTLLDHTKDIVEQSENEEKILELETYSGDIYDKFKTIIDNFNAEIE
jgi:hypothetical protein